MKICMFVRNPFTHDTRVIKEARSLIKAGHQVTVIALLTQGLPESEVREDGIVVQRVGKLEVDEELIKSNLISKWMRFDSDWVFSFFRSLPASLALHFYKLKNIFLFFSPLTFLLSFFGFAFKGLIIFPVKVVVGMIKKTLKALSKVSNFAKGNIYFSPTYEDFIHAGLHSSADIYHAHDLNILLPAIITAKKMGARIVYDSHELFVNRNSKESKLKRLGWILLESQLIKQVDAVITVSDSIADVLAKRYQIDPPIVVRNVQAYTPFQNSENLRNVLELNRMSSQACFAIYAGRITFGRGLEKLITASQYLNNVVIIIIGGGNDSYRRNIEKRIRQFNVEDRVLVLPPVSPDLVHQYLCSADIGLMPTENLCLSYYYGAGNKLFHYLMAGLPVVVSDHPEKRKIVDTFNVGRVFSNEDPRDLAQVIQELADDTDGRRHLSKNCLEAAKILNWENEEQKLLQLYQRFTHHRLGDVLSRN